VNVIYLKGNKRLKDKTNLKVPASFFALTWLASSPIQMLVPAVAEKCLA
jgi:hypothetical protein